MIFNAHSHLLHENSLSQSYSDAILTEKILGQNAIKLLKI